MRNPLPLALLCSTALTPVLGMPAHEIVKAANSREPNVHWQQRSVVKGDFTCASRQSLAILGVQGSLLKVAVFVQGVAKPPIVLEIASDLLATQTVMAIESQDFEVGTKEPGDPGPLSGFRRSKTCKGLKLDDGRIDSVHIYWNRSKGKFQYWQR